MKIETFYDGELRSDGVPTMVPITIVDKEVLPNANKLGPTNRDIRHFVAIQKRLPYTIKWHTKEDPDYKKGITHITIEGDVLRKIELSGLNRIKMKIIWREYWLLKRDNIKDFVFPVFMFLLGVVVGHFGTGPKCPPDIKPNTETTYQKK